MEKVYLKVDEDGKTLNVFDSLGMAICGIEQETKRISKEFITLQSVTRLEWTGRDGKKRIREIRECPICKDVTLDYMGGPRYMALNLQ